mmetsp:Transcript_2558/g.4716  ORF Transcript_2558/g.4716 Transcript_2558/m.4716 type:complete len:110 (+) Transcript_2558:129-458(+)
MVMSNGKLDWNDPNTFTGMLDRSPCGTGTCAVMAHLHANGKLGVGEHFLHESVIGSLFTGVIVEETKVGDFNAIIPKISGSSWVTGNCEILLDPSDPFPQGYTVGDIWA